MKYKLFYKNFFIKLGMDALILAAAFYFAHLIRFDFEIPFPFYLSFQRTLPVVLILKLSCFYFFDQYSGMWRYTSISDLLNLIKATTVSSLLIIFFILYSTRFINFSRSIIVIDWCFTILCISGFRLSVRLFFDVHAEKDSSKSILLQRFSSLFKKNKTNRKNLIIIGAGDCGEKIYREISDNTLLLYKIVSFLDDDHDKVGKKIHGVPIIGHIKDIAQVAKKVKADEALIAIPSATSQQIRKIVAHCEESGIKYKIIPGYGELINGKLTIKAIRDVSYQDLLGREVINLDEEQIGAYLKGQRVLVTGAGGSIGSELCRQICRFEPEIIVLYERAESPLYEIELDLKQQFANLKVVPLLADIQNIHQIKKAFEIFKPQTVFHAAAYKHVSMLELQPWRAIENNIKGTQNLIAIVKKFNIERFVFVSTDKAVRPANVMGASKRVTEMLVQSQNARKKLKTKFMIVRFGNVVGSVGSVVPLFRKQIKKGGPVTVTDPEVTRYFMTIPEACQLILQAGAMGNGGEIFLFDMGTPIKIADMARDLIRLSGLVPDEDIKIDYIGLRPGEKLYEELITNDEGFVSTGHEKILVIKGIKRNPAILNAEIEQLVRLSKEQDQEKIKAKLKKIVPEYKPVI